MFLDQAGEIIVQASRYRRKAFRYCKRHNLDNSNVGQFGMTELKQHASKYSVYFILEDGVGKSIDKYPTFIIKYAYKAWLEQIKLVYLK